MLQMTRRLYGESDGVLIVSLARPDSSHDNLPHCLAERRVHGGSAIVRLIERPSGVKLHRSTSSIRKGELHRNYNGVYDFLNLFGLGEEPLW
jgi:hypothetical protein